MPLVRRTRATLRSAEFGFFGVCVNTRTHTPRFCGLFWSAGLLVFVRTLSRPLRTSWLIVGTVRTTPVTRASVRRTRIHEHTTAARTSARHAPSVECSRPQEPQDGPAPGTDLPYKVVMRGPFGPPDTTGLCFRVAFRDVGLLDRVSQGRPEPCKDTKRAASHARG